MLVAKLTDNKPVYSQSITNARYVGSCNIRSISVAVSHRDSSDESSSLTLIDCSHFKQKVNGLSKKGQKGAVNWHLKGKRAGFKKGRAERPSIPR